MPGARCTRSLAWKKVEPHERSHREVHRNHPAFPHAMVLTAYFVISLVIGSLVTITCELGCLRPVGPTRLRRLDAGIEASGPHDLTVRACAVRRSRLGIAHGRPALQSPARQRCRGHRILPRVRDDHDTPLGGAGRRGL